MNSFDVYDTYVHVHRSKKAKFREFNDFILQSFKNAEQSIEIYSGALDSFDRELTESIMSILSERDKLYIKVLCGDRILAEQVGSTKYVPLIDGLKKTHARNSAIESNIIFNHLCLDDQIKGGYFHSVIIDGGASVMVESPHDHLDKDEERHRIYFEDATILAEDLVENYNRYSILYDLISYDDAASSKDKKLNPKILLKDELEQFFPRHGNLRDNYSLILN